MNCFAIAAVGLRLLATDVSTHDGSAEAYVRSQCGIEIGVADRDGHLAGEAGLSFRLPGLPIRILGGAIVDRQRETTFVHSSPSPGAHGPAIVSKTSLEPEWRVRGRAAVHAEFRVAPHLMLTGGIEALPRRAGMLGLEYRF